MKSAKRMSAEQAVALWEELTEKAVNSHSHAFKILNYIQDNRHKL